MMAGSLHINRTEEVIQSRISRRLVTFYPQKNFREPGILMHTCHPSTGEAEAGGSEFESSLGYIARPCLKN
jgi:hypothetical protein